MLLRISDFFFYNSHMVGLTLLTGINVIEFMRVLWNLMKFGM